MGKREKAIEKYFSGKKKSKKQLERERQENVIEVRWGMLLAIILVFIAMGMFIYFIKSKIY